MKYKLILTKYWKQIGITIFLICLGVLLITYYFKRQQQFKKTKKETYTNQNENMELMLFSVDWCPHCKTVKPIWNDLKTTYEHKKINGNAVLFTDINCTNNQNKTMMDKYNITSFPTIKLIKDNQTYDFDAKPTKDSLIQFIKSIS